MLLLFLVLSACCLSVKWLSPRLKKTLFLAQIPDILPRAEMTVVVRPIVDQIRQAARAQKTVDLNHREVTILEVAPLDQTVPVVHLNLHEQKQKQTRPELK